MIRAIQETCTVAENENLTTLAERFETTIDEFITDNPEITNPNLIYVGQKLRIPGQFRYISDCDFIPAETSADNTAYARCVAEEKAAARDL